MRSTGVVAVRVLILLVAVAVLAGCSAEMNRLKGQNQSLVTQRDQITKENADLKALLEQDAQQRAELEAQVKKAQVDADYWKGESGAYSDAYAERKKLGDMGFSEKLMREIAEKINAVYIPGGGIRLSSDVLFDSGKSELKGSGQESLKKVAEALSSEDAKGLHLRVDGHTDGQPIRYSHWKDNMELSQARARAVWVELKNTGVAPDRMFTAGFGEFAPIDSNSSATGRANNRRVELWVVQAPAVTGATAVPAAGEEPSKDKIAEKSSEELPEPTK